MKEYEKNGLKFAISTTYKPMENGVVFFTQDEYVWITQQNLEPDEFKALWLLKRDDFRYQVIPPLDNLKAKSMADKYCEAIMASIKTGVWHEGN